MNPQTFISTLPIVIVGIAAFTSLISFKNDYPGPLKKMSILWIINFCMDLAGHITRYYKIRNSWIYNIWYWIFYLSLAYLYQQEIKSKSVNVITQWFYIMFSILVLVECAGWGITNLQTGVVVAGGVFIIFLALAYFRQLYLSEENGMISRDAWFWFSFGLIIYLGGAIPFLGMLNYLFSAAPRFTRIYYIYFVNTLAVLLNLLIIAGFLCLKNYPRRSL